MDLKQLRDGIDDTDSEILSLFLKRMELCRGVAEYKRMHNLPVFQGGREQEVIDRIKSLTADPQLENGTAALFTTIMDISKHLQNRKLLADAPDYSFAVPDFENAETVACQGISGANSETAARMIFGDKKLTFMRTFEDVYSAVEKGEAQYGVIPIHNSTAGSVAAAYDLMAKYSVYIVRTVCVEINHCLAAKRDIPLSDIKCVYSHPQALAQCSEYITHNRLRTEEYANTAMAAEMVKNSSEDIAAVCSVDCAQRLGLHILAEDIADCSVNRTKFICISRDLQVLPEADTISVMLKIPHTEGSLYRLLTKFFVNGMNLCRIESRPIKDGSFDALFYLDFGGKITDPDVKVMLTDLASNLEYFRFIGTSVNEY